MSSDDRSDREQSAAPQSDESAELAAGAHIELDDALTRRHSRGRRAAGIGVLALAALLAAALVVHTAVGARLAFVRAPVVATHRPIGVALVSNIAFGTLTLNGRQLGSPPQAVTLRGGTNAITLSAPPFATRRCNITWPSLAVLSGRCTVSVGFFVAELSAALDVEYAIALDFDGHDLPPDAAASARAALDTGITGARLQTIVPGGQRIATAWTPHAPTTIASMSVAQPVQAQLTFTPTAGAASDCPADLCGGPEFIPGFYGQEPLGGPAWMLSVGVSYTWRFLTQSGAQIASVTYPSDAPAAIALVLDSDGNGWHLWQPGRPATDTEPQAALARTVCDWASVFRVALPGVPSPANVGAQVGPGIEGCAIYMSAVDGTPIGTLVWRFGVLLAGESLAHARFPALPVASADELRAVGA